MRKIVAFILLLLFYSINPVKADDNLKNVYKDVIEYNNIFALLYIEEEIEKSGYNYSKLGITAEDFRLAKARVCTSYLTSANSLTLIKEERDLVELACPPNEAVASAF